MSNLPSNFGNFLIYDYTGSESSDTYALPFTPLTFIPKLNNESDLLSNKRIVWDFGDNTTTEAITAIHAYKDIGTFNVTCFLYDKNGDSYQSTYTKPVTIRNYLTDSILINAPVTANYTLGAGKLETPFIITNSISWQGVESDPTKNISIISYISGGNCYDYFRDKIFEEKYGHLYPYYSTYLLLTSSQNKTEFVEVSSFTTNATPLYIKLSGSSIIRCESTDTEAFFAGLTGSREVFFKTDVNTTGANLFFGYQPDTLRPFSNTSTVGVAISVVSNNDYNKLSISSNGLDSEGTSSDIFNIGAIKFNNTKIGFVITVKDSNNFTIKGIPQLTNINICLTDGDTVYSDVVFTKLDTLSGIPLGGFFMGYFVSNIPGGAENVYIQASANIDGVVLTGTSNTFNIYVPENTYSIAKKGETIDFKQKFKEIAFQPLFINKKILFDDFLGSIFGDLSSAQTSIGKATYEKIENFINNNATLDYSNINQLESLLKTIDVDLTKFSTNNLNFPAEIGRLVNLLSINYSRLRGGINSFDTNFKTYGYLNHSTYGKNLGPEVSLDYELDGSSDIVAFEKFSGVYKKVSGLIPPFLGNNILTEDNFKVLSNNNLPLVSETSNTVAWKKIKDYNIDWGWGLLLPQDGYGENLNNYYLFYEYIPGIEGTITDSIINYEDFNTTLSHTSSSYSEWSQKDGIISNILAKSLYDGLDLFVN